MQNALRRGSSLLIGRIAQAPTFRKVHIGDNAATSKTLSTEPYRPGPPHTGPGQLTNEVVTAKYTAFNFVAKNLWEQFHRPANIYFLCISVLQCIKAISITGGTPTTLGPLIMVLLATLVKDGIEDFHRHQADAEENSRTVTRMIGPDGKHRRRSSSGPASQQGGKSWYQRVRKMSGVGGGNSPTGSTETVPWLDVRVGDMLEIHNRENIPADIAMLSCSDPKGTCFVMTANLDGETNLKPRVINPGVRDAVVAAKERGGKDEGREGQEGVLALAAKGACVECDLPNQRLEHFDGTLVLPNGDRVSLHGKNVLLRGCQLRNTEWCRGVVVYSGRETKIQMNAAEPPNKYSSLKVDVDRETLRVLCLQIACCFVGGVYAGIRAAGSDVKKMYHIWGGRDAGPQSPALTAFLKFWSFIIIFTNFVPISLLVTLDMVKLFQSRLIEWDREMYHEAKDFDGSRKPMPANVRSSELNEDLGRVKHIFSDKTGTLTCNVMNFRKCSIRGQTFGLGTTEIGLNYRKRNGLPVPLVPPMPPGAKQTMQVNFVDPEFTRVMENAAHPLHDATLEFYLHLALNHEVQPEQQPDGRVLYSASNPDEGALINAASHFGHRFLRRDGRDLVVAVTVRRQKTAVAAIGGGNGGGEGGEKASGLRFSMEQEGGGEAASNWVEEEEEKKFQVLHNFAFTSDRKRSSVVVRKEEDGRGVVLYCKGADNVIFERLDPGKNSPELVEKIKDNIAEFTRDGLRTLLTAKTERTEEEYQLWLKTFQEAETSMEGREEKVKAAAALMEEGLEIMGVTAIEDKLQDGVSDALHTLQQAGIKVWMLTGDKVDTAINIGHSCSLLNPEMDTLRLCADDEEEEDDKTIPKQEVKSDQDMKPTKSPADAGAAIMAGFDLSPMSSENEAPVAVADERTRLELDPAGIPSEASLKGLMGELTVQAVQLASIRKDGGSSEAAIVVDTYALSGISQYGLEKEFVYLCSLCTSVVCARVSPRQKSLVVGMVRTASPEVITLCVGDGANDVPMLQSAHLGVGIHGLEGAQAVNNSDYSLGQFRFLKKLLLVHGRWSYRRVCKVIVYMFYKNALLVLPQFFFAFVSLSSGQNFYYDLLYQAYNLLFTSLPIIVLGVFDQDVTSEVAQTYPALYRDGVEHTHLTTLIFWRWMAEGGVHAAIVMFLPMAALGSGGVLPGGRGIGLWGFGLVVYFAVVIVANGRLAMENKMWTVLFASVFGLSIAVFVVCWFFFSEISFFTTGLPQISGTMRMIGGTWWLWLTLTVTISAALLLSYFGVAWSALFLTTRDVVGQEISSTQRRRETAEKRKNQASWTVGRGQVLPVSMNSSTNTKRDFTVSAFSAGSMKGRTTSASTRVAH